MRKDRLGLGMVAAVAAVLATAAPAAGAGPAAAGPVRVDTVDAPLTPTLENCESFGRRILCLVGFTGGTEPITIRWTVNGSPAPGFNDSRSLSQPCAVGSFTQVSVVVADAAGSQFGFGRSVRCIANFP